MAGRLSELTMTREITGVYMLVDGDVVKQAGRIRGLVRDESSLGNND